ncbi:MAG: serine hydrolase [bacterium]|nr:serine hydrolase [bacterium]
MDERLIAEIAAMADKKIEIFGLPGMVLGIVNADGLVWSKGFGRQNITRPEVPDKDSLGRIASIAKTFTATAILQLREEQKLSLEDPLTRHLPEFARVRLRAGALADVTLRRLLTHHSGLATEAPLPGWDTLDFPTREAILNALDQTEVVIEQDSTWKYSNLAYALLGEVIQRASRQDYEKYIQANILDPLELKATCFDLDAETRPRLMTGYNPSLSQDYPLEAPYAHLKGLSAAGQLHSNVSDLARWVAFQFRASAGKRQGQQILSGRSLSEMHRPQYLAQDWSSGQCLGWRATRRGDRVFHNHGGGIHGFATQVWFSVPHRIGVVQMISMWPPPGGQELVPEILEHLLEHPGQLERTSRKPPVPVPEAYRPLLGHYCAQPGIWVSIEWRSGELQLRPFGGQTSSLHAPAVLKSAEEPDSFRVVGGRAAGERVLFERREGRVIQYELGAFVFKKLIDAGEPL